MLRVSCHTCGSMFLVRDFPEGPLLCPACHTVDAANQKHKRPKRKSPNKPTTVQPAASAEKGADDGTRSPT